MRILAIESSSLVAGIAILEDDIIIAEYNLNFKLTHSQTLLPILDYIKKMIDLDLNTIDAIAVSGGPGSFTGLRIGLATAKGLAKAISKPLINVPTLEAMAYNLYRTKSIIVPIMDARKEQVYTASYRNFDKLEILSKPRAVSIFELIEDLNQVEEDYIFIGDGILAYKEEIKKHMKQNFVFAPANFNRQRGASLASLAKLYYEQKKYCAPADFELEYLRKSQAERQREEISV